MKIKTILKYSILIKIRELKALFKTFKFTLLAAFIILVYILYKFSIAYSINQKIIVTNGNYILMGLTIVIVSQALLTKKYPFIQNPCNMIYFSIYDFKKYFLTLDFINKLIKHGMIAIIIGMLLLDINTISIFYIILFWNILFSSLVYRFLKYNKNNNLKVNIFYIIIIGLSILGISNKSYSFISLVISIICNIFLVRIIIYSHIKFDKIFRINEYNNRIQFASRHMIITDLEQITSETQVSKKRNKKYRKKLTKDNAIVEKIILSFKRTDLHLVRNLFIFLIIITIVYRLRLFKYIPLINLSRLDKIVVSYIIAIYFINVLQLFYNEFDSMIIKKREGMYLPFTDMEILFKFYSLIIPLNIIAIIIVSVILNSKLYLTVLVLLLYLILSVLYFYILYRFKNKNIKSILSLLSIIVAYLLLI